MTDGFILFSVADIRSYQTAEKDSFEVLCKAKTEEKS
jgi:hypothetical protein